MELPHFAAERVAPPARLPEAPPALAPVQQHVKITLPDSALAVIQPVKPPALPVQLGSFSTPVVEKTTLARTPAATGAFGGVANVAARPARDAVATGGFGEATASRTSRTGGAGTAGPGGFGDAVASAEPKEPGQVRAGGFQSAQAVETTKPSAQAVEQGPDSPVAILDKPRPGYTEEARQLKIEGEVLLEVCFGASGRVRVLRVIKGLGHGLDESAVRAAEAIRFRPASRKGTPVDATAEAHITFQLAY
jgi:TonB family protein